MTRPHERTRSLVQTEEFLRELTKDPELPERVRTEAKHLLRHYPDAQTVFTLGKFEEFLESTPPDDPRRELAIVVHSAILSSRIDR
ncbi:BPSL0761 family protein [Pseudomonas aeruginosa]|uniref:BPSL0761 family protein n=1 Tax=Pseudomonas aeruginosa TaxID=287 RepID=UPI002896F942|nr:BPSL0761 family protein [Pseudomonas aeruginosa]